MIDTFPEAFAFSVAWFAFIVFADMALRWHALKTVDRMTGEFRRIVGEDSAPGPDEGARANRRRG